MKKKQMSTLTGLQIVLAVYLTMISSTLVLGQQNSQTSPAKQTTQVTTEFSDSGSLLKVRTPNGKELFSNGTTPLLEGYAITYRVKNAKTGEEGAEKAINSIGKDFSKDQLTKIPVEAIGKMPFKAFSSIVVQTPDKVAVCSCYVIDKKAKTFSVVRQIVNLSENEIVIVSVEGIAPRDLVSKPSPGHVSNAYFIEGASSIDGGHANPGEPICPIMTLKLKKGPIGPRPNPVASLKPSEAMALITKLKAN